jgi:hypothetical protein
MRAVGPERWLAAATIGKKLAAQAPKRRPGHKFLRKWRALGGAYGLRLRLARIRNCGQGGPMRLQVFNCGISLSAVSRSIERTSSAPKP